MIKYYYFHFLILDILKQLDREIRLFLYTCILIFYTKEENFYKFCWHIAVFAISLQKRKTETLNIKTYGYGMENKLL